ncbi:hypothetical protein [Gordonia paraffinivorans]|uniref:Mce-associated membrane protein n=1 Tax=Gordonia paraffinivorans TaxID=175628 RepID=A0ABD7V2L4_9ACTN|nr:hypothetical protein [Gordonia paraffinivorans]MCD2144987.1 hypothetical protein [Gordonia paraffinivorans]VFA88476.1 Uncharacterised protein [Gordonia paraffinivorans]
MTTIEKATAQENIPEKTAPEKSVTGESAPDGTTAAKTSVANHDTHEAHDTDESVVVVGESADDIHPAEGDATTPPIGPVDRREPRRLPRPPLVGVLSVLLLVALTGLAWVSISLHSVNQRVAEDQAHERARQAAAEIAAEYATRSMNFSYTDPDGFVAEMKKGITPEFAKKYESAVDLIRGVMQQAKLISRGDVLATHLISSTGDPGTDGATYRFVVVGNQISRSVQRPEEAPSQVVLDVAVTERDGRRLISDFGVLDDADDTAPVPTEPR